MPFLIQGKGFQVLTHMSGSIKQTKPKYTKLIFADKVVSFLHLSLILTPLLALLTII